jgi:hypothetical protein
VDRSKRPDATLLVVQICEKLSLDSYIPQQPEGGGQSVLYVHGGSTSMAQPEYATQYVRPALNAEGEQGHDMPLRACVSTD